MLMPLIKKLLSHYLDCLLKLNHAPHFPQLQMIRLNHIEFKIIFTTNLTLTFLPNKQKHNTNECIQRFNISMKSVSEQCKNIFAPLIQPNVIGHQKSSRNHIIKFVRKHNKTYTKSQKATYNPMPSQDNSILRIYSKNNFTKTESSVTAVHKRIIDSTHVTCDL